METVESTLPTEILIRDWPHFVKLATDFVNVGLPIIAAYGFRGQARADWLLVPSLGRMARSAGLNAGQTLTLERAALEEFQKQAHLYLPAGTLPRRLGEDEIVAWWSLMQHYRVPTRTLDWTGSPFVALYFAVEQEPDQPGAVWAVHFHTVVQYMREMHKDYDQFEALKTHQSFLTANAELRLYSMEQKIQTDRMFAQQMCYTVSTQVLADHGQIILTAMPSRPGVMLYCKLVIPGELKAVFMRNLRAMNVTARSLFPGVEGVGMSVAELVKLGCLHPSSIKSDEAKKE